MESQSQVLRLSACFLILDFQLSRFISIYAHTMSSTSLKYTVPWLLFSNHIAMTGKINFLLPITEALFIMACSVGGPVVGKNIIEVVTFWRMRLLAHG